MTTDDLLKRFHDGPTLIDRTLGGHPPSSGLADSEGWSVREVLVHLADAE